MYKWVQLNLIMVTLWWTNIPLREEHKFSYHFILWSGLMQTFTICAPHWQAFVPGWEIEEGECLSVGKFWHLHYATLPCCICNNSSCEGTKRNLTFCNVSHSVSSHLWFFLQIFGWDDFRRLLHYNRPKLLHMRTKITELQFFSTSPVTINAEHNLGT